MAEKGKNKIEKRKKEEKRKKGEEKETDQKPKYREIQTNPHVLYIHNRKK